MSPLKYSIAAAIASIATTAGVLYRSHGKQVYAVEELRYRNGQMQFQAYQRLHPQPVSVVSAVPPPPDGTGEQAVTARSHQGFRNEGQSTPRAALQTFVWACDQGDVETVAQMLFFAPEDRQQAEVFFAQRPEKVRGQWKSVDEMAAALLVVSSMARSFPAADVLAAVPFEPMGENRVTCRVPHQIQFHQANGLWKYVITAAAFENLERDFAAGFGP